MLRQVAGNLAKVLKGNPLHSQSIRKGIRLGPIRRGRGVRGRGGGGEQQKGLSAAKVPLLQKLGHLLSNLSASPMVELVLGDPIDGGNGLESKLWRG